VAANSREWRRRPDRVASPTVGPYDIVTYSASILPRNLGDRVS